MKTKSINAVLIFLLLFTFSCQKDLYEDEILVKNQKNNVKEIKLIPFSTFKANKKAYSKFDDYSRSIKSKYAK
jgi:hypothetical protein